MNKNRFIYWSILFAMFLFNSCSKNDNEDCYFVPEITTNMDKSHPCLSTGIIEIIAPIDVNFTYKIDQGNFQHNTVFENISAGKHILTIKDYLIVRFLS